MSLLDNLGFDRATDYDFGAEFDYTSWDEHTQLMLTNVPINTDYRDIVQMDGGLPSWNAWLDAQPNYTYTNASLQKFNEGIVKIDLPMNKAMKYNYLRARNGSTPTGDDQRDYFYFVTGIRYGAPNTTYVSLQLDVITTFLPEITFGYSYLERGHIGIANGNQFNAYGREYLTVPEGLDLGGEYRTVHVEFERIMDSFTGSNAVSDTNGYDVLVCSTLDLTQYPGTLDAPSLKSATGSEFQGIPSGASFYLFPSGADLFNFFIAYTDKPWITESIISITIVPNMKRYIPGYDYGTNLSTDISFKFYPATNQRPSKRAVSVLPDWRNSDFIEHVLGFEYAKLKKFYTYPYMVIEMTSWSGSPLIIKPESWQDADAKVNEYVGLLPPGQRIAISPNRYNADVETLTLSQGAVTSIDDFGESLDFAVTLDDFPQLPVVNNTAAAFLASNKNGLAFSNSSAEWTQQRALAGAQASYDVQNAQVGNTARQSSIANQRDTHITDANAALQVGQSIVSAAGSIPDMGLGAGKAGMAMGGRRSAAPGAAVSAGRAAGGVGGEAGGIGSAAAGMVNAYMAASTSLATTQMANSARSQSSVSDIQTAGSVRDTNNAYATMAAKGDYANAIAGIQARVQDAKMTQPSVSGQFGGNAFNLINNNVGYSLRWKMVNLNALRTLGNYWLRYGYSINQFILMPTSLHCMSKFTYWKLSESYISQGAFPEGFKQIIRGVFEKGVTVWKNPDDIGRTALTDNQPLEGISY